MRLLLRTLLRSTAAVAGLITWVVVAALPVPAEAETTDGTLTVIVNRDIDGNGNYDGTIDEPQRHQDCGNDASGHLVDGVTERDGSFVLAATSTLKGAVFVVAEIPAVLSGLSPCFESSTFQPLSTTVNVTSENQTVRMEFAAGRMSAETPQPDRQACPRNSDRPQVAPFAVGDVVWRDDNRSGVQDAGESPASEVSIQLLNVDGKWSPRR